MQHDALTMFCYTDLAGQVRGKGFPSRQLEKRLKGGIGWTPTNIMFTAMGTIAPSEWGAHGDVLFIPDETTGVEVDFQDGTPAERFYLCDVRNTDGTPWDCCPRTLLKEAVRDLQRETGLTLRATFEHEFIYSGANSRPADNYALDAMRRHGSFGETYLGALRTAGVEVDSYMSEFSEGQFEVTVPPLEALAACDTAVIVKELARATAWRMGQNVSFSPRVTQDGLGNGVHIHFSLWDESGAPVSHDADRPLGVSEPAGRFLAGVVRHMRALCAFTAPTPVSYLRLVPKTWTGVWSNVGYRDREAGLRICPTFNADGAAVAPQFNYEFRAADATGNPYIQLAVLLRAGLAGMRDRLAAPEPTKDADCADLSPQERAARGIVRLPASLDESLAALESDDTARGFLQERMLSAYLTIKRAELALCREMDPAELCRRYAEIY